MKCTALVNLLVVSLVLGSSVVGCKHKPQNLTPLPKPGERPIPDESSRQILTPTPAPGPTIQTEPIPTPAPPVPRDVGPGGGEQTGAPLDDWTPHPDVFKEQTVYFDFDKSAIKPSEIPKLQTVVSKFNTLPGTKALRIEGHCDERGTEEYNRALGERRALAVREKLVSFGLDGSRVQTVSHGEDRPVDPGHNETAWAKNRRGEIILLTPPGAK